MMSATTLIENKAKFLGRKDALTENNLYWKFTAVSIINIIIITMIVDSCDTISVISHFLVFVMDYRSMNLWTFR